MNGPTLNDTEAPASVWYELAAIEIEIGTAGHVVKLPMTVPGVLEPWSIRETHVSQKNIGGKPRQMLTVCFARQVVAGDAPQQQPRRPAVEMRPAPAPPARSAGLTRRLQAGAALPSPRALAATPGDVATVVENTVAGAVAAVAGSVGELLSGLGVGTPTPAPVAIPDGQGCTCAEPVPAVEHTSAAAIPCRACGGWISTAEQPA